MVSAVGVVGGGGQAVISCTACSCTYIANVQLWK